MGFFNWNSISISAWVFIHVYAFLLDPVMYWAVLIAYQSYVCIFWAFVGLSFRELFLYIFFKLFEFFDEVYVCPGIEIRELGEGVPLIIHIVCTFVGKLRYVELFCYF